MNTIIVKSGQKLNRNEDREFLDFMMKTSPMLDTSLTGYSPVLVIATHKDGGDEYGFFADKVGFAKVKDYLRGLNMRPTYFIKLSEEDKRACERFPVIHNVSLSSKPIVKEPKEEREFFIGQPCVVFNGHEERDGIITRVLRSKKKCRVIMTASGREQIVSWKDIK